MSGVPCVDETEQGEKMLASPRSTLGDASCFAFWAFGVCTFCGGAVNTGWYTGSDLAMYGPGFMFGGLAQVLAGVFELIKGDTVSSFTQLEISQCYTRQPPLWMRCFYIPLAARRHYFHCLRSILAQLRRAPMARTEPSILLSRQCRVYPFCWRVHVWLGICCTANLAIHL